jgi:hypothetical protein
MDARVEGGHAITSPPPGDLTPGPPGGPGRNRGETPPAALVSRLALGLMAVVISAAVITGINALLLLYMTARSSPKRVYVAVDLAPDEILEFGNILRSLEPRLGARIIPVYVATDNQLAQLELNNVEWDLIVFDNDSIRGMVDKGRLRDLLEQGDQPLFDAEGRDALLKGAGLNGPARRILREAGEDADRDEETASFVPFRLNVKVGFFDEGVFPDHDRRGHDSPWTLAPPRSLRELAEVAERLARTKTAANSIGGHGRLVIQGFPYKAAAVTMFEALGGDEGLLNYLSGLRSRPRDEDERASETPEDTARDRKLRSIIEDLLIVLSCVSEDSSFIKFDTASDFLVNGKVDLLDNWSYSYREIVEAGRNLKNARPIGVYEGWQGRHVLGGDVLAIPKTARTPELAARLIELLLEVDIQRIIARRLCWIPVRDQAFDALPDALHAAIGRALRYAVVRPLKPGSRWKGKEGSEGTLNDLLSRLSRWTQDVSCDNCDNIRAFEAWYNREFSAERKRAIINQYLARAAPVDGVLADGILLQWAKKSTHDDQDLFKNAGLWREVIRIRADFIHKNLYKIHSCEDTVAPMAPNQERAASPAPPPAGRADLPAAAKNTDQGPR